ncbi:MAG: site-2 protease family protein [Chloroflexi bacterium]|nr:site-2 protease family protein [Chloroflexota bacterium]
MVNLLSFAVILSLLVFVHELGHLVAAKLGGVRVNEFGFGYPPRLVKLGQWRETEITLNWLPIGGFVRMGEDDPTSEGGLSSKPRKVRALVLLAGPLMNLLLAAVLFGAMYMVGAAMPVEGPGAGIYAIAPNSPADDAGIKPGDTIVEMNGETVDTVEEAIAITQANLGQPVSIVLRRNDKLLEPVTASPRLQPPENEGALGVSLGYPFTVQRYSFGRSVALGFRATYSVVTSIPSVIVGMIRKEVPAEVSGVVGIYSMTAEAVKSGWAQLLEFAGLLSVNFFMLNLLPLPALDGGRLLFVLLEWLRGGRKVPPEKEGLVHAIGMMALLVLMAVVTYNDILRLLR